MTLLLKNLLFTLVVPGSVAVWVPWFLVRDAAAQPLLRHLVAFPFFAAGVLIYVWTTTNFAVIGRGTPAPIDAPRKLIVRGPHRYVRNPMYLGVLSAVAGWVVTFRTVELLVYAIAVAIAFHTVVLLVEEPSLRRQFGEEYASYCTEVRRWIPGRPVPPR